MESSLNRYRRNCVLCHDGTLEPFLRIPSVPVHVGVLWPTDHAARGAATGDLTLAMCHTCGLVSNTTFDAARIDYTQKYDNALHASPVFREFEQQLAHRLIDRYDLHQKTVAEIGCGNGHFLGLLCKLGDNDGLGFDPSHDPAHVDPLAADRVQIVSEPFSELHTPPVPDLLCCRQTLEHVADPAEILVPVRRALRGSGSVVYYEVPNSTMPFRDLSVWDLIYEHCVYFVAPSLRRAFEWHGFEVLDLHESYAGQFLGIEARPTDRPRHPHVDEAGLAALRTDVAAFADRFHERLATWRQRLDRFTREGTRAVVWGAGARAVSFFNMLGISDSIELVVDLNVRKQGSHLGGTGQRIVAPDVLRDYRPDVVVVLNPLYTDEIRAELQRLGCPAEVLPA